MTAAPLILIFGMHRSGTSALARALSLGGVALPSTLLESRADNTEGYWESARMVAMNEEILRALGGHALAAFTREMRARERSARATIVRELERVYERECPRDRVVVVKDPRMCLLAEAHLDAARRQGRRVHAVVLVRDAGSAAGSLVARNVVSREYAGLLWRQHVLFAEAATRAIPRTLVRHRTFLADPVGVVTAIRDAVGCNEENATPLEADKVRAWVHPDRVYWSPERAASTDDEREVDQAVFSDTADRAALLDALRERAFDDCGRVDPGCVPLWLILQSNATIGWAQVAALAMDRGVSAAPGAVDAFLRGEALRFGGLGSES
ncbi:MAG: hypothetical protein JNM94_15300 [Phycisphaerae bacterium]|nr:hypothetical protein [Phycisphaerae bacterium]